MLIVMFCTFIGAAAQVLIKSGANHVPRAGIMDAFIGILTNPYLFFGYALYGLFTALLVVALRDGELSLLYPIIALTYVWVAILSVVVFHEPMNAFKLAGVSIIVIGVAILGKGAKT